MIKYDQFRQTYMHAFIHTDRQTGRHRYTYTILAYSYDIDISYIFLKSDCNTAA